MARRTQTPAETFASKIRRIEREAEKLAADALSHDDANALCRKLQARMWKATKAAYNNGVEPEHASGEDTRVNGMIADARDSATANYRVQLDAAIVDAHHKKQEAWNALGT